MIGEFATRLVDERRLAYLSAAAVMRSGVDCFGPLIAAVEQAYMAHARGDVLLPKSDYLRYPEHPSYDRIIPLLGYLGHPFAVSGLKQICSGTGNVALGFPRASGLIILNDPATNRPFGLLEASLISAARTAAVSGLALREFSGPAMGVVAIVGCGQLGLTHIQMIIQEHGADRFEFLIHDVMAERAAAAVDLARALGAAAQATATARAAIEAADIIIPATTAEQAHIKAEWLRADHLYCAVSLLDAELDVFRRADHIVVDDLKQCLHENRPLDQLDRLGELREGQAIEIGTLIGRDRTWGQGQGRLVFNPMGTVITDLAVAKTLFDRAAEAGDFVLLEI